MTHHLPSDLWRVRLMRLDAMDDFDLEYHDDILYRSHEAGSVDINEMWRVDIMSVIDGQIKRSFEPHSTRGEAEDLYRQIKGDLQKLSTDSFADLYIVSK